MEYIEDHVQGESYFLRQIAGVALQRYYVNSGVRQVDFLIRDHLGSIHTVVQDNGTLERMHFGAFGERVSDVDWTTSLGAAIDLNEISTRGLTGHEHVDSLGIIHMNGRIYDPKLGRFLQADPFVQFPKSGQNLNRYSYVMNNPLSYTDPSGYFLDKLWDAIKPFIGIIVAAVIVIATGGTGGWVAAAWYNAAIVGAASGAASAAVNGGNILRGALLGGIAGAAGYGIGTLGLQGAEAFFANGALGGSIAELGGGNFGHGFLSAGVGNMVGSHFGPDPSWEGFFATVISAGTVSEVTGGKFGNGAAGAALGYAINATANYGRNKQSIGSGDRATLVDEANRKELQEKLNALRTDKTLSSSRTFASADDAAVEVLSATAPLSQEYGLEIFGYIEKVGDRFAYTFPQIGESNRAFVSTSHIVYHTHPDGALLFSNQFAPLGGGNDAAWVRASDKPLYLGVNTSDGIRIGVCEPLACSDAGFRGTPPSRVIR